MREPSRNSLRSDRSLTEKPQLERGEPDELLVQKILKGEQGAFDRLVKRYQDSAVRLAFSFLRNWEDAKEVSQNAFLKAYFGLKHFRAESTFKTWFYRILVNQAKDSYRRTHRRREKSGAETILYLAPAPGETVQEKMQLEERKRDLEKAVEGLPEKQKEVFMLRNYHDLPLNEISETLGIALGTVKAHLAQALEKIRSGIEAVAPRD